VADSDTDAVPPGVAVTESDPVFVPALAGTNLTPMVQVPAAASVMVLQLSVAIANSVERVMLADKVPVDAPPVLVTVNVTGVPCAPGKSDVNVGFAGVTVSAPGPTAEAVSIKVAEPPVVALTVRVPVGAPGAAGARLTCTVQVAAAASTVVPLTQSPAAGGLCENPAPLTATVRVLDDCWPGLVTTNVSTSGVPTTTVPKFAEDPAAAVSIKDAAESPVPASEADADAPGVAPTVKVAARAPVAAGWNATTRVQLAPAPSMPMHVLEDTVNSVPLVPPSALASAVVVPAATPPRLVTVNVTPALVAPTAVLAKVVVAGLMLSVAGERPTPVRPDDAVPPGIPLTRSVPLFGPELAGAKVTAIVQVAAAASDRSLHPSAPFTNSVDPAMLAVSTPVGVPPVLVTVNVVGLLCVPCNTEPKAWVGGAIVSAPGATASPCRLAFAAPPSMAVTLSLAPWAPVVVGVNLTVTMQSPPAAMAPVHVLAEMENEAAYVPSSATAGTLVGCPPVFET
jgi:hypothetical protein